MTVFFSLAIAVFYLQERLHTDLRVINELAKSAQVAVESRQNSTVLTTLVSKVNAMANQLDFFKDVFSGKAKPIQQERHALLQQGKDDSEDQDRNPENSDLD